MRSIFKIYCSTSSQDR